MTKLTGKGQAMRQLSPDDSGSEIEKLYEYYQQPIVRYLMGLVHDQELARDLYQDTFERVLKYKETILQQTAKSWLYRIATNLARDAHRHTKLIDFLPIPESEAELNVEGDEDRICDLLWLREEVPQMPEKYRDCFLSKHYYGYTQQETAAKLGISESAVSSNVSRGKTELRRKYYPETADFKRAVASSAERDIDRLLRGLFRGGVWEGWKKSGEIRLGSRRYTKEQIRVVNEERTFYRLHSPHSVMGDDEPPDEPGDAEITRRFFAWPGELVIIRQAKIIPLPPDFRLP